MRRVEVSEEVCTSVGCFEFLSFLIEGARVHPIEEIVM